MSQKQRKPLGIWGQILLGFGVFILVVGALLWLFQMVLLEPFYRGVKTAEVKGAAESVVRCLEDDDMKEEVEEAGIGRRGEGVGLVGGRHRRSDAGDDDAARVSRLSSEVNAVWQGAVD